MFKGTLSVFFPAYNEEKNIEKATLRAVEFLRTLNLEKWEVIIVDDGSKDRTGEISDQLATKDSHIRVVHQKNGGYGEAIKTGFREAKYDWVFFTDSDLQFDITELTKFLDRTDEADLVIGYRINRQDPPIRKLNGWGWTMLSNLLLGLHVKDVDCAFKLIKKEVIEKVTPLESRRGGMISPELLAKAQKNGFKILEVGVKHFERKEGNPTGASLSVILESFKDLFKLASKLR